MKIVFVILFIGWSFTQSTSLSLYGVGDKSIVTDVATIALGNSTFFSGNKYNISTNSSSSLWRSSLTRFTIHSGMNYLTNLQIPKQYEHELTFFSLMFPVGNKKVIGLGIQPAFRTNKIEIEEMFQYNNNSSLPFAYYHKYFVNGGISKVFIQYSWKAANNLSFGFQYSSLFGNQFIEDELYICKVKSDTLKSNGIVITEMIDNGITYYIHPDPANSEIINVTKSHQFTGSEIMIEGRYSTFKQEWAFRIGFNGETTVKTKMEQIFPNYLNSKYVNTSDGKLSEIDFGYHYKLSDHLGIVLESQSNYPFNIPKSVALFHTLPPKGTSINIGTYYQYINPKVGFWNNINLRGGGYLKELNFTKEKYLDYGITVGLGLEYLANTQSLDFAFRFGNKESFIIEGENENYISFHIGITTGEKWFFNSRRK